MSYTLSRHQYAIEYYVTLLERGDYSFPHWQREDCWCKAFKVGLIKYPPFVIVA